MVPAKAEYALKGSVLKVEGKLDFSEEQALRKNGERLAGAAAAEVLLDLSAVLYIASSCLGVILLLHENLARKGVRLKVRLSRALLYIYDLMGVRSVVETEIVG